MTSYRERSRLEVVCFMAALARAAKDRREAESYVHELYALMIGR